MHPLIPITAAGALVYYLLSEDEPNIDCSQDLTQFYNAHVRLSNKMQKILRGHRDTNRTRLETGLAREGLPTPLHFVHQGSHAVDTINQSDTNDYDIDDGVVFDREALKQVYGRDMTPREAKEMVCSILQQPGFSKQPEIMKNCVRVYYSAGHHVDLPVYRTYEHWFWGTQCIELASGNEWRDSDPEAVCEWFNKAVIEKSPDETNGRQLRRVVRLLKKWAKSRPSWNIPSGFLLSILAVECYKPFAGRDDLALYHLLKKIHWRLKWWSKYIEHPIFSRSVSDDKQPKIAFLQGQLSKALATMEPLLKKNCTNEDALKVWSTIFNTEFFGNLT